MNFLFGNRIVLFFLYNGIYFFSKAHSCLQSRRLPFCPGNQGTLHIKDFFSRQAGACIITMNATSEDRVATMEQLYLLRCARSDLSGSGLFHAGFQVFDACKHVPAKSSVVACEHFRLIPQLPGHQPLALQYLACQIIRKHKEWAVPKISSSRFC